MSDIAVKMNMGTFEQYIKLINFRIVSSHPHMPSCIVTTKPSRTGFNPLKYIKLRGDEDGTQSRFQLMKNMIHLTFYIAVPFPKKQRYSDHPQLDIQES